MRKLLAAALFAFACGHAAAGGLVAEPARPLPAVRDAHLTGLLAQHKGHPLLINFWASWCEPCREEMPSLQRLADRWKSRGLSVLTVAVADKPASFTDFLWEASVILPVLGDPEQTVARAWGVRALPTTLVLDKRHRVVARGRGAIDWDAAEIDTQLAKLLK
jgi:thiol-disulfide isomerase/thioredoxin